MNYYNWFGILFINYIKVERIINNGTWPHYGISKHHAWFATATSPGLVKNWGDASCPDQTSEGIEEQEIGDVKGLFSKIESYYEHTWAKGWITSVNLAKSIGTSYEKSSLHEPSKSKATDGELETQSSKQERDQPVCAELLFAGSHLLETHRCRQKS